MCCYTSSKCVCVCRCCWCCLLLLLLCCSNDLASSHFQSPFSCVMWLRLTHFANFRFAFAGAAKYSRTSAKRAKFLVLRWSLYGTGTDKITHWTLTHQRKISIAGVSEFFMFLCCLPKAFHLVSLTVSIFFRCVCVWCTSVVC